MQRENTWCALQWEAADAVFKANNTQYTIGNLSTVCHPCVFAYVNRFKIIAEKIFAAKLLLSGGVFTDTVLDAMYAAQNLTIDLTYLGYACVTDLSGDYCYPQLEAYPTGWAAPCSGGLTCTAACKAAINNFIGTLGCCAGTYWSFLEWVCAVEKLFNTPQQCNPDPFAITVWVESSLGCDIQIPKGCFAQKHPIAAKLVFENLDWGWCSLNLVLCEVYIRDIILYRTGITNSSLPLASSGTSSQGTRRLLQSGSNTAVQFTAVDDFADLSNAASDLNDTAAGSNAFSGFAVAAKLIPQAAVKITGCVGAPGGASLAGPSALLVMILLALVKVF